MISERISRARVLKKETASREGEKDDSLLLTLLFFYWLYTACPALAARHEVVKNEKATTSLVSFLILFGSA